MRVYWDSTALLNALVAGPVVQRFSKGEHVTRTHAYVEAFHHLSGRGLPMKDGTRKKVSATDAARMIRRLSVKLSIRDLDLAEILKALDDAQTAGVSGGNIHDWIHARSAKLAGAELILTRDDDFVTLSEKEGITTDWP
jgi:predicted nucleic acid-binding protein